MKVTHMTTPPQNDHPLYQQSKHPTEIPSDNPPRQRPKRPAEDRPYVTYILIAINLLVFLAGFISKETQTQLLIDGSLYPPSVVEGNQLYRLFTAMFIHAGAAHVFFNMYALYIVGNMIEPIFGRLRFGLIYFLGGLAGSVMSLALGNYAVPSVGASGAIFAIFIAEAVHLYHHRQLYRNVKGQLRQILVLIGFNIFIGFTPGSRIDNWGHIGGLIGGAILAWRIAPRISRPTTPIKSMTELAKLDTNPLINHLPDLVIYSLALVGVLIVALSLLAS
jgi:rhomboid protease GluP